MKYTHLEYGDITFALAPLFSQFPHYEKKLIRARESGREIMLDNGAWEFGRSINITEYLEILQLLEPTYAVIPDAIKNKELTKKLTLEFFDKYLELGLNTQLIFAPQGETEQEMIDCYNEISDMFSQHIQILGIPKHIGELVNRVVFTDKLFDCANIKFEKVHFLGYWNWEELAFSPKLRGDYPIKWYLHSIDTKYPVKYAYLPERTFFDQLEYYTTDEEISLANLEEAVNAFGSNLVKLKCQKK